MIVTKESPPTEKSPKDQEDSPQRQIQEAAQAALRSSGYRAVARLKCDVLEGTIVLSGTVSSYYYKQIAQAVVLRLASVDRVENLIVVRRS
jgi:hypothetical protein